MRFLFEPAEASGLEELREGCRTASESGLDGLYLAPTPQLPAALIAAAAIGGVEPDGLIAAEVRLGDRNPIELAEEAAVVDLGLKGRLILVVRPAPDQPDRFPEGLDLLRTALAARPFRRQGAHWQVPANLPENVNGPEHLIRVTPAPFQPRLEIWGVGPAAGCARERGLGHVGDVDDPVETIEEGWASVARNPAAIGTPRARRHLFRDPADLVEELRAGRERFDQDWAIVRGATADATLIGRQVRPQVQIDRLPTGLTDFWNRRRGSGDVSMPTLKPIME